MRKADLFIGGALRGAARGRRCQRLNPVTGRAVTNVAAASVRDAQMAAEAAQAGFAIWSQTTPAKRREVLFQASRALLDAGDEIATAMCEEIGATQGWARFNLELAAQMLVEAGAMTTLPDGATIPSNRPGCTAMALRQPVGVVLSIAPWNAPIILGVRAIATALACGNSVVFKSSEICPRTHLLMVQAIAGAGLPDGALNAVSNDPEMADKVVGALIDHPAIRRVNFTGSTRVGRLIAERAARNLKPALLELGGKAPMIVLEDADLDAAVAAAVFGAFMNQGQICMSTERIIVVDSIADEFAQAFGRKVALIRAGNPAKHDLPLGAMVSREAAVRVRRLIANAVAGGAVLLAGGTGKGAVLDATALDYVTREMRIYTEESFGPVAAIIRVADEAEAVAVANDSDYGLASAVFSRDQARALRVARQIHSGICHINGPTVHDEAQMPFGGVKASGYGRFGGLQGIEAFTETRWITLQDGPLSYPF